MSRVTLCPPDFASNDISSIRNDAHTLSTTVHQLIALIYSLKHSSALQTSLLCVLPYPFVTALVPAPISIYIWFLHTIPMTIPHAIDSIIRTGFQVHRASLHLTKASCTRFDTDWLIAFDRECATTGSPHVLLAIVPTIPSRYHTSRSIQYYASYLSFCLRHQVLGCA